MSSLFDKVFSVPGNEDILRGDKVITAQDVCKNRQHNCGEMYHSVQCYSSFQLKGFIVYRFSLQLISKIVLDVHQMTLKKALI
jgi:hypothetical protein